MSSPTVQILGAYKLDSTPELFAQAMAWKYGSVSLSLEERRLAEQHVRNELAGVVLIEALISQRDERFNVADFGQAGSDQAPYTEVFLSEDGRAVIAEAYDVPADSTLRIAFYLHYVEPVGTSTQVTVQSNCRRCPQSQHGLWSSFPMNQLHDAPSQLERTVIRRRWTAQRAAAELRR